MNKSWDFVVDGHHRKLDLWAYPFLASCWRQVKEDGVPFRLVVDWQDPLWVRLESDVDFVFAGDVDSEVSEYLDEAEYEEFVHFLHSGDRQGYRLVEIYMNEIDFPSADEME